MHGGAIHFKEQIRLLPHLLSSLLSLSPAGGELRTQAEPGPAAKHKNDTTSHENQKKFKPIETG